MSSESTTPDGRGPWARVLFAPQVASLATASIVGRLPFGMGGVAFVIFVHARTGSFGVAGLVTGFYTLAFALAGPVLGRQVDRRGRGHRRVTIHAPGRREHHLPVCRIPGRSRMIAKEASAPAAGPACGKSGKSGETRGWRRP